MVVFIFRRLIGMILVLFAVSFITYLIFIKIPGGDPAQAIAGKLATAQNIADIRHKLGLDRPFYIQYYDLMRAIFERKLVSYQSQLNVVGQIQEGIPATFSLAIGAGIIWLTFGIIVGVVSALTAGRLSDRAITVFALVGISIPVAVLGIVSRYVLAEGHPWHIFPDSGYVPLTDSPTQWFYHLILPWWVLAVLFIGFYGRVLRSTILDTVNEDYVRTARAKGISSRRILFKHTLRNSLIPILTLFGLDFAGVLGGGAILTETVFNLQGVGQYAAQSITTLDLPPIIAVTIFATFFIVIFNFLVDLMYAWLDPRIRTV